MTDDEGVLLARIIIERHMNGGVEQIRYRAGDGAGNPVPLVEQLGMLTLSVDTAIRTGGQG